MDSDRLFKRQLAGGSECMSVGRCDGSTVLRLLQPRIFERAPPVWSKARRGHAAARCVKGVPAVLAAKLLALPVWLQGLVGLAVLLGHSYPIWFSFRGGKSVSSAFGVLLVLVPSVALITALCWALLAWRLRTAAAASLISALLAPLLCLWLAPATSAL